MCVCVCVISKFFSVVTQASCFKQSSKLGLIYISRIC